MRIMIGHSIKRLRREGKKSLSVPLIAFVFVVLINFLGGLRTWLDTQYEDTMDNFPIVAVISDLAGENTNDLHIDMRYIDLFLDPDVHFSLMEHTGSIIMRRPAGSVGISDFEAEISLIGISDIRVDELLEENVVITFFEGYDEAAFNSDGFFCLVSDDLSSIAESGTSNITFTFQMPDEMIFDDDVYVEGAPGPGRRYYRNWITVDPTFGNMVTRVYLDPEWDDFYTIVPGEIITLEAEFTIIGTVSGAGDALIYSPFWTVSTLAEELTEIPPYTESLSVILSNNRELDDFKETAKMSFSRTNPVADSRPFAMTIYDMEFYETLEPLRQNIIVVDVATPFIYILSIAVGFLTSVLLTRRRKAEFAIMRSIGVSKWVVFASALTEQALLSIAGAALGFALVAAAWSYTSLTRPAVFLACYLLGAIFAATGAAGTNVMKVLRDRRE